MLTSTFLTLFVVPVVYTLLDDVAVKFRRRKAAASVTTGLAEIPAK
jgi:hypothetical protein